MSLNLSQTIEIAAPPDRVFDAMTRVDSYGEWMPNFVSAELLTTGPVGVGTQWREMRKLFGHTATEVFEITEFDRPRRLVLRVDGTKGSSRKGEYLFRYDLEPVAAGTRVVMTGEIHMPGGWFTKLMGKLFAGMFKKMCAKDLESMKAYAEKS